MIIPTMIRVIMVETLETNLVLVEVSDLPITLTREVLEMEQHPTEEKGRKERTGALGLEIEVLVSLEPADSRETPEFVP